jgi:TonB family protein
MKKIVFLLFSCILLTLEVSAQRQNTYLLKHNGDYVTKEDSADYVRIVQEPVEGSTLYQVKEYYISGGKKSYGLSSRIDPPLYEGQVISFYQNGIKKQFANYVHGKIADSMYNYFPNGKLYSARFYTQVGDSTIIDVRSVNDSTGVPLVVNGNGHAVFYDENFSYVTGKGNIENGKYNGAWTGELRTSDTLRYKEVYSNGKMLSGESTDGKGHVYHYTRSEVEPHFQGGKNTFLKQVASRIKYPRHLAARKIQGVAHIKFVILPSGEIADVHAINDVDPGLAAEAIRVIKGSKAWEPGRQKGRPVRVSYVVPLTFSLR